MAFDELMLNLLIIVNDVINHWRSLVLSAIGTVIPQAIPDTKSVRAIGQRRPHFSNIAILIATAGTSTAPIRTCKKCEEFRINHRRNKNSFIS